jgi:hypothetical protein
MPLPTEQRRVASSPILILALTPILVPVSMLRSAIGHVLDSFQLAGAEAKEVATAFKDVIVADASVIKLIDDLKTVFPGCRTNTAPAAAKIHAFLSVKGAGRSTVSITSERVHDKKKLLIGPWVRGRLPPRPRGAN